VAQLLAAGSMWIAGFRIGIAPNEAINLALTLVWIVGITNAFNLLDNMDGLTGGLAALAAATFGAMGIMGHLPALPLLAFSLSGACFGFLLHNRFPAKIYMGDAGSTFIGFLIATIGLQVRFDNLPEVTFLIPVVVLALPILDTTLVVVSRLRSGRPVFAGGRDHISHRLVSLGLSVRVSVGILYWAQICLGWLGIVVSQSSVKVGWMLLGFVISLGLFFMLTLLSVPVYEEEFDDPKEFRKTRRRGGIKYEQAIDNAVEIKLPH
jgi:UDP-GlcNAc:undecaprenyl-phosphate GlcNAc-1-phosphate transferase